MLQHELDLCTRVGVGEWTGIVSDRWMVGKVLPAAVVPVLADCNAARYLRADISLHSHCAASLATISASSSTAAQHVCLRRVAGSKH